MDLQWRIVLFHVLISFRALRDLFGSYLHVGRMTVLWIFGFGINGGVFHVTMPVLDVGIQKIAKTDAVIACQQCVCVCGPSEKM